MEITKGNSFSKQFIIVTLVAICLLFLFTECKASTSNTEITMWTFLNPTGTAGREIALNKMISSFEEKTGIKVIVEPQQWNTMTAKFFAANTIGNAPDVAWVERPQLGAAVKMGTLVPLEDLFLDFWSKEDVEDVDSALWQEIDGKHYQVTLSANCNGIIYREDLFKEKGIATPIKTWNELIDAAQKLTGKDTETGIERWGLGMALSMDKATTMTMNSSLLDLQGCFFTKDGKANWANDNGIKSMQLQVDMVQKYKITPLDSITATAEDLLKDFSAGKYAMIMAPAVRVPKIKSEVPFDPDIVKLMPYPSWDEDKIAPIIIGGWSVGVWSESGNKKEAGQFLEYMINKESDKLWVFNGGQVPVRKSTILENKEFFEQPEKQYLSVMKEIIDNGYLTPTDFTTAGFRLDLNWATQEILVGRLGIEDALKAAEDRFNKRNPK